MSHRVLLPLVFGCLCIAVVSSALAQAPVKKTVSGRRPKVIESAQNAKSGEPSTTEATPGKNQTPNPSGQAAQSAPRLREINQTLARNKLQVVEAEYRLALETRQKAPGLISHYELTRKELDVTRARLELERLSAANPEETRAFSRQIAQLGVAVAQTDLARAQNVHRSAPHTVSRHNLREQELLVERARLNVNQVDAQDARQKRVVEIELAENAVRIAEAQYRLKQEADRLSVPAVSPLELKRGRLLIERARIEVERLRAAPLESSTIPKKR